MLLLSISRNQVRMHLSTVIRPCMLTPFLSTGAPGLACQRGRSGGAQVRSCRRSGRPPALAALRKLSQDCTDKKNHQSESECGQRGSRPAYETSRVRTNPKTPAARNESAAHPRLCSKKSAHSILSAIRAPLSSFSTPDWSMARTQLSFALQHHLVQGRRTKAHSMRSRD